MNKNLLGGISPEQFLKKYWQKKPLLIKQAFPEFKSSITKDELIEFSTKEECASRLVIEKGGDYPWQVMNGPFQKEIINSLPKTHWTILVQEMNSHHPEIAELLHSFSFIPNWRIDDIMISYAAKYGTVGAHVDNYDVFLLQGNGKRKWRINYTPIEDEVLIEDLDIRVLKKFKTDEEWILEPGDMLYLPPKIAHYGISMDDDCMTYSVGFRTPSYRDIAVGFSAYMMEEIPESKFYADGNLSIQKYSGEIKQEAVSKVQKILKEIISDRDSLESWLGRFVTEPKRGFYREGFKQFSETQIEKNLEKGQTLFRHGSTKISYLETESVFKLFVNGNEIDILKPDRKFAEEISSEPQINSDLLIKFMKKKYLKELVLELINSGAFEFGR